MIRDLIADGYSLVIYPEGGRSPDGWGQSFKGGAAYLSSRTGAPVVPVFIDGTGSIFGKGMKKPKPGRTKVIFGHPLMPEDGESTRRFNARIEAAVTALGDEALTDYWTARRRAHAGTSPSLVRPGVQRLAPPVGAVGAAQARRRRPPPPPAAPLARPRLRNLRRENPDLSASNGPWLHFEADRTGGGPRVGVMRRLRRLVVLPVAVARRVVLDRDDDVVGRHAVADHDVDRRHDDDDARGVHHDGR